MSYDFESVVGARETSILGSKIHDIAHHGGGEGRKGGRKEGRRIKKDERKKIRKKERDEERIEGWLIVDLILLKEIRIKEIIKEGKKEVKN